MRSMTGYGRCTQTIDGRQLTIELKSVNHRFLDLSFRMPRSFAFLEEDARRIIGGRLSRGHVDVFATYRNLRTDARTVTVDAALLGAYMGALDSIGQASGLRDDRSLMSISRLPDVLVVEEAEEDRDALKQLMAAALNGALDELVAMREREGVSMKADLSHRVDEIERMTRLIEQRYPETVAEYQQRLKQRVEELLGGDMDEQRLLQEVAVMADRSAIAEETVRLHSHIAQLRELFEVDEPVGRRIDFIVQELNREVNTISSKSQDIPITRQVVNCKAEIEKLREQLQNVE
ncbi:MAG: YicC/YloC family endoribonuclease [Clostridia bacterium]|nr:YicC/YloC family endoribonuclease [Clostridia bacterium]